MINIDDLYIVNYCHPNCVPLRNIMRLPKDEAYALAHEMAEKNKETTAFYRFADFENYYPLRLKTDKILYDTFISLGGKPQTEHPLSFVLQGSEYLDHWFDCGSVTRIPLKSIPSEFISFTYGDSVSTLKRTGKIHMITKEMLAEDLKGYEGTIDDYMKEIKEKCHYIEVQLWNDDYAVLNK
ncbi:MAG: hypothetical protein ACOX3Q_05275 [Clostridia bacterium]|jgi:hypothetical protein|nr:hypothetical protein [Clostridiaceae bacterium]